MVTFCTGDAELCRRMAEEIRALVPDRRHFIATAENWPALRRELKRHRIGLAPVLLSRESSALRRAAYRLAPRKILAYNSRLERHHMRLDLASLLFWRGVPLDRIYFRPKWWPFPKRVHTVVPQGHRRFEGRPCSPERPRMAVLTPYFPYPLAHGGAVRIYNLLRERRANSTSNCSPSPKGPHRRRWRRSRFLRAHSPGREAALSGAEVVHPAAARSPRIPLACHAHGYRRRAHARSDSSSLQVEYTQLAQYAGDVLVEHDVTFDLFGQIARRDRTISTCWDCFRWRRFERRAVRRYRASS